jgi:glucokinase
VQEFIQQTCAAPRLLADIGGTNARFALEVAPHRFEALTVFACNAYPDLKSALSAYLNSALVRSLYAGAIQHAAIAIANPVTGDVISMTNHHWSFSIAALKQAMQFETLIVANDFTALAMALPHLHESERIQIGGGTPQAGKVVGLIGPGTGLGVSGIIPAGDNWIPLNSEGGHVSFSPANPAETRILEAIWRDLPHVSAERLISGMGMELLYRVLCGLDGVQNVLPLSAAEISQRALDGSCAVCEKTIAHFCAMLGTVAGNLAMTLGATGGVYIGGGIVPRLGRLFTESAFRQRFEAKGRFTPFLSQIPTYLITAEYPAFLGISAILAEQLHTPSMLTSGDLT